MKKINIYAFLMVLISVSFLGHLVENICCLVDLGFMDNRSMVLPFLAGYGMGIGVLYLVFDTPDQMRFFRKELKIKNIWVKRLIYFLIAFVLISIMEIIIGTAAEKFCNFLWWDYSRFPLHFTKFTSVPTSTGFGILVLLFMDKLFWKLHDLFLKWNSKPLKVIAVVLTVLVILDFFYSSWLLYTTQGLIIRWRITI